MNEKNLNNIILKIRQEKDFNSLLVLAKEVKELAPSNDQLTLVTEEYEKSLFNALEARR